MTTTTIKLSGGDLGLETMAVRCDLSAATSSVEVDYHKGEGWKTTPYRAGDIRHRVPGLIGVGKRLAAQAVDIAEDDFDCEAEEVD